jgi:hypothetical protein
MILNVRVRQKICVFNLLFNVLASIIKYVFFEGSAYKEMYCRMSIFDGFGQEELNLNLF